MRICIISSSFYPATFYGGPIYATLGLAENLASSGIEVFVSTTDANGKKQLNLDNKSQYIKLRNNLFIKYYHEQIINFLSISFLLNIWKDIQNCETIYIQYIFHYTSFIGLFFARIQAKKIIICPRGSFSSFTLNRKRSFLKKIWLYFFKLFSDNTYWHASSYLEAEDIRVQFPKANIREINDGIDFDSFQKIRGISAKDIMKKYTQKIFPNVSEIIFSLGRLHVIKRFDVVIDAFRLYKIKNPNVKLIIAGGDDGCRDKLIDQINRSELTDDVFLIGEVNHEEKAELLTNTAIFALASEFESFGIVIAEALACGARIVVSDKTSWKKIQKINCGILAKNDKNEFYESFQKIKEKKHDKEYCRRYAKDNFDWEIISSQFIRYFLKSK